MSSPSDHDQWLHNFYQQNRNSPATGFYGQTSDPTTVTATHTTTTTAIRSGPLSPEGRVTKTTARRRSRASRRTPTTLLNTDTTNFRAMVQQFTGGPTTASSFPTRPSFTFTLGGGSNAAASGAGAGPMMGPLGFNNLQYQNHHQFNNQLHQQGHIRQQQQQQQEPFMFSSGSVATGGDHGFLQRLAAENNNNNNVSSTIVPNNVAPPPTSTSENRGHNGNFMF
ncbi:hypothetical protein ACFE04_011749 [Oxalis oulophora]